MTFIPKKEEIEMRTMYAETLLELAEKDEKVIALEADLSSAITTSKVKDQLKNQFLNLGIMEAEMIGTAAGLSVTGFKPFVHTFANFATRRVYDQVFVSLAYAQLNAVILGSDAGVTAEHNGGTHMPFEDLSLMRIIPHNKVYEASDSTLLKYLLHKGYEEKGLTYIRTIRKKAVKLYEKDETFETGSKTLREGNDVAILASGIMVSDALEAANQLTKEGIEAMVVDMYQLKPIDKEAILKAAETGAIITAENHNVIGGLGGAVSEVLAEEAPTHLYRIGIREKFGQVGTTNWLKEDYKITVDEIVKQAKRLILKKSEIK